jgi:protein-disulfide isomerase
MGPPVIPISRSKRSTSANGRYHSSKSRCLRMNAIELQMAPLKQAVHIGLEPFLGVLTQGKVLDDYKHRNAMAETRPDTTLQVVEGDHTRGPAGAATTVLVYGDYECPHTRALELSLARVRRLDGDAFRSVFRSFPLREIHPHAQRAAEAAEATYALGGVDAFWVMHDGLFAHQDHLDQAGLERRAAEAGVDPMALRAALEARRFADRVERDVDSGRANGVDGTPSIFINGGRYLGTRDVASLREAIAPALGESIAP